MSLPPAKSDTIPNSTRNYCKCTYLEPTHTIEKFNAWNLSAKVDGVRLIKNSQTNRVTTRSGEAVLPHIEAAMLASPYIDVELFAGDWSKSISVLRGTLPFTPDMLYGIVPTDPRLNMGVAAMTYERANNIMETLVARGIEGLIMRNGAIWLKVVPLHTADVRIIGFKEGKGRNTGRLGSIETNYGFISGMDDAFRDVIWNNKHVFLNAIIEVEFRERNPSGKFRFARFKRVRADKSTESLPWVK